MEYNNYLFMFTIYIIIINLYDMLIKNGSLKKKKETNPTIFILLHFV